MIGSAFIEWKIGKSRGSLVGDPEVTGSFRQVTAVVIFGRISTAKYCQNDLVLRPITYAEMLFTVVGCFNNIPVSSCEVNDPIVVARLAIEPQLLSPAKKTCQVKLAVTKIELSKPW